jgi:hypothetical protein
MRSQDKQRIMGNGMSHDDYSDTSDAEHYYGDGVFVRFPNDDSKKWKELSGEVKTYKLEDINEN